MNKYLCYLRLRNTAAAIAVIAIPVNIPAKKDRARCLDAVLLDICLQKGEWGRDVDNISQMFSVNIMSSMETHEMFHSWMPPLVVH